MEAFMLTYTRLTLGAALLLVGVATAAAQTPPASPMGQMPPATGAAGGMPMMGAAGMMTGDTTQTMPMMRMMQTMRHMMGAGGDGMGMMPFAHVEGHIAFLKAELAITDAQLPQWNVFADALRSGAKAMQEAMTKRMQAGMPASAPDQSDAMVQMMTTRLDGLKAMVAAEKALYTVLTDAQKKVADELMSGPMGMMR
jgi:hypothetical protein